MTLELKSVNIGAEDKRRMEEAIGRVGAMTDMKKRNETKEKEKIDLLKIIDKILRSHPHEAIRRTGDWLPVVIEMSLDVDSALVREKAFQIIKLVADHAQQYPNLGVSLRNPIKESIVPLMKSLLNGVLSAQVINVWGILVKILGKSLHQGSSVLNSLLEVITRCFVMKDYKTHRRAYVVWNNLVDNFGTDIDVLTSPQRLILTLKPLIAGPCKSEEVARAKMLTWWNLLVSVKNQLETNFTKAAFPFLRFCVGGDCEVIAVSSASGVDTPQKNNIRTPTKFGAALQSPLTPNSPKVYMFDVSGNSPSKQKQLQTFKNVQTMVGEILLKMICRNTDNIEGFKLDMLLTPCITKTETVEQYSSFLLQCLRIWIRVEQTQNIESRLEIIRRVLQGLITLIGECCQAKPESAPTLAEDLLLQFRFLFSESQLPQDVFLTCFESVLNSLVGRIETLSFDSEELREQGPAVYLLKMFTNTIETNEFVCESDDVSSVFLSLAECVFHTPQYKLLAELEKFLNELGDSFNRNKNMKAVAGEAWIEMSQRMVSALQPTTEINQGDNYNHNFSSAYALLAFPLCYSPGSEDMRDTRNVVSAWKSLYEEINSRISLVSTTKDNTCCDEFASYLLHKEAVDFKNLAIVHLLSEVLLEMFSLYTYNTSTRTEDTFRLSPSKYHLKEKRFRPLGDLTTIVELLCRVLVALVETKSTESACVSYGNSTITNCLAAVTQIFERCQTSGDVSLLTSLIEHLSQPMADLIREAGNKDNTALSFKSYQLKKLDRCTSMVLNCLNRHYSGPYDSEFLAQIAPLLDAMFSTPRRQLKSETVEFWQRTFGQTSGLVYPPFLRKTLAELKVKFSISLPGFTGPILKGPEVTPSNPSDATMPIVDAQELINVPIPTGSSPRLRRARDISPLKEPMVVHPSSDKKSSVSKNRKKLSLDNLTDDNSKDYTVIPPEESKKKMALTAHQKEILQTRQPFPFLERLETTSQTPDYIPPMFTDSQSMDSQGFSDRVHDISSKISPVAVQKAKKTIKPILPKLKDCIEDEIKGNDKEENVREPSPEIVPDSPIGEKEKDENKQQFRKHKSDTELLDNDVDEDIIFSSQPVSSATTNLRVTLSGSKRQVTKELATNPKSPTISEDQTSFQLSTVSPKRSADALHSPTKFQKPIRRRIKLAKPGPKSKRLVSIQKTKKGWTSSTPQIESDLLTIGVVAQADEVTISQYSDAGSPTLSVGVTEPELSTQSTINLISDDDDSGNESDDLTLKKISQKIVSSLASNNNINEITNNSNNTKNTENNQNNSELGTNSHVPFVEKEQVSVEIVEENENDDQAVVETFRQVLLTVSSPPPETPPQKPSLKRTWSGSRIDEPNEIHTIQLPDGLPPADATPSAFGILKRRMSAPKGTKSPSSIVLHATPSRHVHFSVDFESLSDSEMQPKSPSKKRKRLNETNATNIDLLKMSSISLPLFTDRFQPRTQKENENTKPIWPSLVDCDANLSEILSQLTTLDGYRSLKMVLNTKFISTVGQFAKMTEAEVMLLRIKQPKLITVRNALHNFEQKLNISSPSADKKNVKEIENQKVLFDDAVKENEKGESPSKEIQTKETDSVGDHSFASNQQQTERYESPSKEINTKEPTSANQQRNDLLNEIRTLAVTLNNRMNDLTKLDYNSFDNRFITVAQTVLLELAKSQ